MSLGNIQLTMFGTQSRFESVIGRVMQAITINIKDKQLVDKVTWLLENLKDDGLEIIPIEDLSDLAQIQATRDEEKIPFEEYLADED